MIKGIGIDLVEISRVEKLITKYGDQFVNRVLTENEVKILSNFKHVKRKVEWVSGRFAAKEAIGKALKTGINRYYHFKNMEILPNDSGLPVVTILREHKQTDWTIQVSITHTKEMAAAYVILESNNLE